MKPLTPFRFLPLGLAAVGCAKAALVTGARVGYDTYESPMGKDETGSHTALPIWTDYMNAALKGRPNRDYPRPEGIVWASMDPKTGRRAGDGNGISESFKTDAEPSVL